MNPMVFTAFFPKQPIHCHRSWSDQVSLVSFVLLNFWPTRSGGRQRQQRGARQRQGPTCLKSDLKSDSRFRQKLNLWNFMNSFSFCSFLPFPNGCLLVFYHIVFGWQPPVSPGQFFRCYSQAPFFGAWISEPLRSTDPGHRTWMRTMRTPIHCCHWQICRRTIGHDGMGISWDFHGFSFW